LQETQQLDSVLISDVPMEHEADSFQTTTRDQLRAMMGRVSYFVESIDPGKIVSESDSTYVDSPQANYQMERQT